jgi:hypothetical protein
VDAGIEQGLFGMEEWIAALIVNLIISVATGWALAMAVRALSTATPAMRIIFMIFPGRGLTLIAMLAFMPEMLLASLRPDGGFWSMLVKSMANSIGDGDLMASFHFMSATAQLSLFATAFTSLVLIRHWMPESLPNVAASALRSFAVIGLGILINTQMSGTTGFGGTFVLKANEFDFVGASAAWWRIVYCVLAVDLFFGVIQAAVLRIDAKRAAIQT